MNDDDEGNLSAEMENAIFNNINDNVSSTASKNNNNINIDNHVITNIELNNNKTKKVLTDNVKKKGNNSKIQITSKDSSKNNVNVNKNSQNLNNNNASNNNNNNYMENKITNFEKKIQNNNEDYQNYKENDSDYEEEFLDDEIDVFTDKGVIITRYNLLQKKLKEKNLQIDILRQQNAEYKKKSNNILDTLKNSKDADIKDKKLIELVKKNQDLNLKIEKYKLKEQNLQKQLNESEKKYNELQNNINTLEKNKNLPVDQIELNNLKKNLKLNENRLTECRNKLQLAKEENTKLNILIRREVGDNFDINRALTEKNYFKPRGEIIDGLKIKVKNLESKLQLIENNNVLNNSNINNSSTTNNNNNSNIKLNVIPYQTYKKDKDNLSKEIENKKNEIKKLNDMNSKLKSRKNVLEKELKDQKEQLTDKIKILLEKSDNDEKLITAMKNELLKKGVNIGNYFEDATFNLNQEILKLRQQIKEKDKYINNLTAMLIPDKNTNVINNNLNNNMNNNNNNMDVDMNNIMNRLAQLELENKQLRNKSEETKISESLAKENAKLRMKIADLEDKLQNK